MLARILTSKILAVYKVSSSFYMLLLFFCYDLGIIWHVSSYTLSKSKIIAWHLHLPFAKKD